MTPAALLARGWLPLLGYFLGSIPFAYLIAWRRGSGDIRAAGSGNVGAANVTRVVGLGAGITTLVFDAAKGYAAVAIAAYATHEDITWMILTGLAAMVGHLFPLWLKFRGGRGVATGLGVFLPICGDAVAFAVVIWLVVVLLWRYVSLGSIAAAASLPFLMYVLYAPRHAPPHIVSAGTTLAAAMIIIRHRPNIERLIRGTEQRFTLRR